MMRVLLPTSRLVLMAGLMAGAVPVSALAQTSPGTVLLAAETGDRAILLSNHWRDDEDRTAAVRVTLGAQTRIVHNGSRVRATLAVNGDKVMVGLFRGGEGAFVRFFGATVEQGRLGPFSLWAEDERFDTDSPFAVIATAEGRGFTVLYQAVAGTAARTMMGHLVGASGWRSPPREVAIPWGLLAITPRPEGGYMLAIRYDQGPGNSILNMVGLSAEGAPTEHPWWASEPGFISDVQFARQGQHLWAFYRGGSGGDQLLSRDVAVSGQWGQSPQRPPRSHFALESSAAYSLRVQGEQITPRLVSPSQ